MTTRSPRLSPASEAAARELVALYAERIRLTHELARCDQPTGAMADAVLMAGDDLRVACELFRARYFPARSRVIVGLYSVLTVSATGRRTELLLDLIDDYTDTGIRQDVAA